MAGPPGRSRKRIELPGRLPEDDPYWKLDGPGQRRARVEYLDVIIVEGYSKPQCIHALQARFGLSRTVAYRAMQQWEEENVPILSQRKRQQVVIARRLEKASGMAIASDRADWLTGAALGQAKFLNLFLTDEETLGDDDAREQFVQALVRAAEQFDAEQLERMQAAVSGALSKRQSS